MGGGKGCEGEGRWASLLSPLEKMDDASIAQLPVVAGSALLGVISREQVLHYLRVLTEPGA